MNHFEHYADTDSRNCLSVVLTKVLVFIVL